MNRNKLFYLTRRPRFLWLCAGLVSLGFFFVGTALSLLNQREPSAVFKMHEMLVSDSPIFGEEESQPVIAEDSIRAIVTQLLTGDQSYDEKLRELQYIAGSSGILAGSFIPEHHAVPALSSNEYRVAAAFWQGCLESAASDIPGSSDLDGMPGVSELKKLAGNDVQYANYALFLLFVTQDKGFAEQSLQQEIELFGESAMREQLVGFYRGSGQYDRLDELRNDPLYQDYIDYFTLQGMALSRMDWPELLRTLIPAAYEHVDIAMVVLALLSGLVWTVILLRFSVSLSLRALPLQLAFPALVLGALAAHATILFIFWQEHQLNFGLGSEIPGQILYCLSIGFREEILKLLCFCPLIPCLWRRSDLEILTVAGLVGLGFAIEENISYFEGSAGLSALGRFVTANFLHISLTAMGGLVLARAMIHRRSADFRAAGATICCIIAFHGLYDAFLIVDLLVDFSWLAFTVFVLLGYQYFGWLRHLRDDWRDPVSVTLFFTVGVTMVTGLTYCLFAWYAGVPIALQAVAGEVISIAILLIMFYREIPETLSD